MLTLVLLVIAAGNDLDYALKNNAPMGEQPSITILCNRPVHDVELTLVRAEDNTRITLHTGRMKRGQKKVLDVKQPEGVFHYEGTLTAEWADVDEPASMPMKFEASVMAPPRLFVDEKDVDIEGRRIEVTMSRPARSLTFTIYGDDGTVIDNGEANFNDEPAGNKLPVVWQASDAKVLRIDIVGHDPQGYFSQTLSLFPWKLEIPHQDVNFESGKSEIPSTEMPKVKAAAQEIQTAIKRYGRLVKIQLSVEGHTDTVGAPESNRVLSEARAASIARAFRKAGVKVPIRYSGLGEDALKVPTPDETDEPENRRAVYTVSVLEPASGAWKPLE